MWTWQPYGYPFIPAQAWAECMSPTTVTRGGACGSEEVAASTETGPLAGVPQEANGPAQARSAAASAAEASKTIICQPCEGRGVRQVLKKGLWALVSCPQCRGSL